MPKLNFDRHVAYSPEQMMMLVGDLASYPRFIPNCKGMEVKPDRLSSEDVRFAKMTLSFGPITQGYTSRVLTNPANGTIDARATDGPFSHLVSQWRFAPDAAGTNVHFDVDFKISNPFVAAVAEPAFAAKQREIMDAFMAEADRRYGPR
jgi:coenzyme Q-binding protein COQ10